MDSITKLNILSIFIFISLIIIALFVVFKVVILFKSLIEYY